jgi:hypothetical protein
MEHALRCLARLIRVLLGPSAVANKKLAFGKRLDVLGVSACCAICALASVCEVFPVAG